MGLKENIQICMPWSVEQLQYVVDHMEEARNFTGLSKRAFAKSIPIQLCLYYRWVSGSTLPQFSCLARLEKTLETFRYVPPVQDRDGLTVEETMAYILQYPFGHIKALCVTMGICPRTWYNWKQGKYQPTLKNLVSVSQHAVANGYRN